MNGVPSLRHRHDVRGISLEHGHVELWAVHPHDLAKVIIDDGELPAAQHTHAKGYKLVGEPDSPNVHRHPDQVHAHPEPDRFMAWPRGTYTHRTPRRMGAGGRKEQ